MGEATLTRVDLALGEYLLYVGEPARHPVPGGSRLSPFDDRIAERDDADTVTDILRTEVRQKAERERADADHADPKRAINHARSLSGHSPQVGRVTTERPVVRMTGDRA
jgi:hypothetical protein